jgi:hypothetical protein
MIYVIVCGSYSDKFNECYFTNEEEAKKYIASMNDGDAWIDYLDEGKVTDKVMKSTVYTEYRCYYTTKFGVKNIRDIRTTINKKPTEVYYSDFSYTRYISVWAVSKEIAEKICYDTLAELKYKVEVEQMKPEIACELI